jgi:hypothetical protein
VHALDDGPPIALDLCASDCGHGQSQPELQDGREVRGQGQD